MILASIKPANSTGSLQTPATLPREAVATTSTGGCLGLRRAASAGLISGRPAKQTIAPAAADCSIASKKSWALRPIWPRRIGLPTLDLVVVIWKPALVSALVKACSAVDAAPQVASG